VLRYRERGLKAVGIAQIEQHTFRNFSSHTAGLEIQNKERLLALNFTGIGAFLLDARENVAGVIAEVDDEAHKLGRVRKLFYALDGADADVQGVQNAERDSGLNRSGCEVVRHVRSPLVPRGVGRSGYTRVTTGIANGRIGDKPKWNEARPDREGVVVGVVFYVTGANFGGDFREWQFQDTGGLELFFIGLAGVFPATRNESFCEGLERT